MHTKPLKTQVVIDIDLCYDLCNEQIVLALNVGYLHVDAVM